jgi:hypothetical protein
MSEETSTETRELDPPIDSVANTLRDLKQRREELVERRRRAQGIYYTVVALCILAFILIPIFIAVTWEPAQGINWISIALVGYAGAFAAMLPMYRVRVRSAEEDIQALDFDIDLQQYEVTAQETRAEKILRLNQLQLRRYYDLNLSQNRWVFLLGVLCILLGVTIIAATLWLVTRANIAFNEKVVIAALGAVGSILTNFVATIYLKMHAAATGSLEAFHSKLVESDSLLLGNLVASRIEDKDKRWSTLSELALLIVEKDRGVIPEGVSANGLQRDSQSRTE